MNSPTTLLTARAIRLFAALCSTLAFAALSIVLLVPAQDAYADGQHDKFDAPDYYLLDDYDEEPDYSDDTDDEGWNGFDEDEDFDADDDNWDDFDADNDNEEDFGDEADDPSDGEDDTDPGELAIMYDDSDDPCDEDDGEFDDESDADDESDDEFYNEDEEYGDDSHDDEDPHDDDAFDISEYDFDGGALVDVAEPSIAICPIGAGKSFGRPSQAEAAYLQISTDSPNAAGTSAASTTEFANDQSSIASTPAPRATLTPAQAPTHANAAATAATTDCGDEPENDEPISPAAPFAALGSTALALLGTRRLVA